jgi:hypothetical protein
MVNVNAPLPFNLTTNGNKQPRISRLHTRSPQPSLDMERQSAVSSASASVSASHELDEDTRRSTLHVRIVRGGSSLARGRPITRDAIAAMHDCRTEEGGDSGTAAGRGESPLPLTAAAAEREAQSPTDGVVRAATVFHLCVWADFRGMFAVFSVPATTVDRPPRGPELVPEWVLVRLRGYPARRSKSKMLDRFRAVGVIEFGLDPMEHTGCERTTRRYIRTFPPFRSHHYYFIQPPIHHIIFRFPHLSPPISLG